jgi:DNA-binding MarR family transcriptional regulator
MPRQHYTASTFRAQISLGYLIKRSHALMRDSLEPVLEQRGFSFVQYILLMSVRDGVAVNPKDLCDQLRHDSGALTRLIDQLAGRGLLERVRRDRDRRKVELQLTPAGRQAIDGLVPSVVDKLNDMLGVFSIEEMQELKRLLVKLNTRLESEEQQRSADAPAPESV